MLAQISTDIAWDQLAVQLQDHLLEVVRAYWRLYLQRAVYVQKQTHLKRAERILEHTQARRGVDALARIIREGRRVDKNVRWRTGFGRQEGHSVAFDRPGEQVEGVLVRECGAMRHLR